MHLNVISFSLLCMCACTHSTHACRCLCACPYMHTYTCMCVYIYIYIQRCEYRFALTFCGFWIVFILYDVTAAQTVLRPHLGTSPLHHECRYRLISFFFQSSLLVIYFRFFLSSAVFRCWWIGNCQVLLYIFLICLRSDWELGKMSGDDFTEFDHSKSRI